MANYKAYPEYKDSGVEWLGDVPNHWKTIAISRLFSRTKRTGYTEKELLSVYRDYGVIPKSSRDDNNNKPSEDLSPYQLVQHNDLVMNKMKAWQGSIAISECEGIVSPAYFVYQPNKILFELAHPRYVHYLLRNPIYVTQYLSRSKGIRVNQWDLDPDEFRKIELLLPTKSEQAKIYSFLDHETEKIDNLIEKQQQLIELLKEKRQAVISHAVTKGLNPDVPMKYSGVEWLCEMPCHWHLQKGKYIFRKVQRTTTDQDGIVTAFRDGQVTLRSNRRVDGFTNALKEIGYQGVKVGDLLVHAMDGFAGAIGISDSDGKCSPVCSVCIPWDAKGIHMRYYGYLIRQLAVTDFISSLAKGIRERSTEFRFSEFSGLSLSVPPLSEQNQIASFLDHETAKIDTLIEKQLQQIELLKERRTALISAAVTGKIDVRDWTAPAPQQQKVEMVEEAMS